MDLRIPYSRVRDRSPRLPSVSSSCVRIRQRKKGVFDVDPSTVPEKPPRLTYNDTLRRLTYRVYLIP